LFQILLTATKKSVVFTGGELFRKTQLWAALVKKYVAPIPNGMIGRDLVACPSSAGGITAGVLCLIIMIRLKNLHPKTLILAPFQELVEQIHEDDKCFSTPSAWLRVSLSEAPNSANNFVKLIT
jgi:hypothetical protein